jgi:hypothetical protein
VNADLLLARLRDAADGAAADKLVTLWLDFALAQPITRWLDPPGAAAYVSEALAAWASSPTAEAALLDAVAVWKDRAAALRRPVGELLPPELRQGLTALVGRPFSPDRALVLGILDREPVRELIRAILVDALMEFSRQVRAPVTGVARGLTGLARMAAETAKSATGSFGAFAGGVVGAVSGEVERQFEKRAAEFVDAALSGVMRRIAEQLSDPRRAAEQGALRMELLEGLLGLSPVQLARELDHADVQGGAALVRDALGRYATSDAAKEQLASALQTLLAPRAQRTTRELLDELGLTDVGLRLGRELGRAQLADFFATDGFEAWCRALAQP